MLESKIYLKLVEFLKSNRPAYLKPVAALIKTIFEIVDKFIRDDCPTYAASLAYTTLIALAPLAAVTLSVISSFALAREETLRFVLESWLPNKEMASVIESTLDSIASNATSVSAFGVFFLALFVIWGLNTIEGSFNMIWKVDKSRPLINKFISFWSAVTFAPVFLAVSLIASAKIENLIGSADWSAYSYFSSFALQALPYFMIWLAFLIIYRVIPNTNVKFKPALIGALVAGALFEKGKDLFNVYVSNYATYSEVYGALSILAIFLFWIYLSWLILLFGAVVAYAIQYPRKVSIELMKTSAHYRYAPYYALRALIESARSMLDGAPAVSRAALCRRLSLDKRHVAEITQELARLKLIEFIAGAKQERFVIARSPESIRFCDLILSLQFNQLDIPERPDDSERAELARLFEQTRAGLISRIDQVTLKELAIKASTKSSSENDKETEEPAPQS